MDISLVLTLPLLRFQFKWEEIIFTGIFFIIGIVASLVWYSNYKTKSSDAFSWVHICVFELWFIPIIFLACNSQILAYFFAYRSASALEKNLTMVRQKRLPPEAEDRGLFYVTLYFVSPVGFSYDEESTEEKQDERLKEYALWIIARFIGLSALCSGIDTEWISHPDALTYAYVLMIFLGLSLCMDMNSFLLCCCSPHIVPMETFCWPILATSAVDFWRRWNLLMGMHLNRICYRPLRAFAIPKWLAAVITFLLSGLLHEFFFYCAFLSSPYNKFMIFSPYRFGYFMAFFAYAAAGCSLQQLLLYIFPMFRKTPRPIAIVWQLYLVIIWNGCSLFTKPLEEIGFFQEIISIVPHIKQIN